MYVKNGYETCLLISRNKIQKIKIFSPNTVKQIYSSLIASKFSEMFSEFFFENNNVSANLELSLENTLHVKD
jgi:hypothetical protein